MVTAARAYSFFLRRSAASSRSRMAGSMRKLVCRKRAMAEAKSISPRSAAKSRTPSVPVTAKPRRRAASAPSRSSIRTKSASTKSQQDSVVFAAVKVEQRRIIRLRNQRHDLKPGGWPGQPQSNQFRRFRMLELGGHGFRDEHLSIDLGK